MKQNIPSLLRTALSRLRGRPAPAPRPARPRLRFPLAGSIVYAVGDVHGCLDALLELEERIVEDGLCYSEPKFVVMLGDYIDRGPASAQVLHHLQTPLPQGFRRICLCGNHEEMMLDFLDRPRLDAPWMRFGGDSTMRSYGIDLHWLKRLHGDSEALADLMLDAVPAEDVEFLKSLPVMVVADEFVFAHAGLRPGVPLVEQTDQDLLWIREPFLEQGPQLPLTVVHGHTPVDKAKLSNGRVGIDTNVYATGILTGLRIAEGKLNVL